MVNLSLYEAVVIDIDDETKKRRIKIRILPEHKDVKTSDLPWASPFSCVNSIEEFENDLPIKDSIIYVLVDPYWKRFYYIGNKFFYNMFDFASVTTTLSKASEISNKDYKNIKFRLYEDGGLEFHNKSDGSHGFIHKSGSYSIFDADGNISMNTGTKEIKIDATGKVVVNGQKIELNGNTKNFVTHAELNTSLQTEATAINEEFTKIATTLGACLAAFNTLGIPVSPPYTPALVSVNITSSRTNSVVTG